MSMPSEGGGGGNVFTRKLGPMPMWAWMAIGVVLAYVYHKYTASKSGTTTASANTPQSAATNNTPGGVDSSLVPQFINQEYVNTSPPVAPNVTVNNTVPSSPVTINNPAPTPTAPAPAPAKTISGAPGSYTTGLPSGENEWTSTGQYSLNTVAKSHGMTAQQLIASSESQQNNTGMVAYVKKGNYNAPMPSGLEVFIPNANWSK